MTDGLLTNKQAAEWLGLGTNTLEQMRVKGGGPAFVKLGRSVRYRPQDLAEFAAKRVRKSTSEPA